MTRRSFFTKLGIASIAAKFIPSALAKEKKTLAQIDVEKYLFRLRQRSIDAHLKQFAKEDWRAMAYLMERRDLEFFEPNKKAR